MKSINVHTIVLGSGAAGLAAALRLKEEGIDDLLLLTEGLRLGTSINTGSDKQTYYKLGIYGSRPDSPAELAESYTSGGGMHGDLALVEAALSARAFFNLVNLGVPFPHNSTGEYIGYKTDNDPRRRATSCGPYTSREMCRALSGALRLHGIEIRENRIALRLLKVQQKDETRICGLLAVDQSTGRIELYRAENIVFAVGGPGGLYQTSVYPIVHTGAIGLALMIGAAARGLPESQYGIASFTDISKRVQIPSDEQADDRSDTITKTTSASESRFGSNPIEPALAPVFRWNISGTFMQVLPKFISTDSDGVSQEREFLPAYFGSIGKMNSRVFLKGYQWPFDVRKAIGGSSLIDLIVYYETVICGRRVFLDFRSNPTGTDFNELDPEAREYLEKSEALFGTPFDRLEKMNPGAVALYREHAIDLASEPLEIAVCAQHNNGGLAGTIWYESENIRHFFPIGEVNGSHGIARPGGSALNAGQVGAFRAAEYIAKKYRDFSLNDDLFETTAKAALDELQGQIASIRRSSTDWRTDRRTFQKRMSENAAHFRSAAKVEQAAQDAREQFRTLFVNSQVSAVGSADRSIEIDSAGCEKVEQIVLTDDETERLRNIQLCFAHAAYLDAIRFQIASGTGSRGSAMTTSSDGLPVHPLLPDDWKIQLENEDFRNSALVSVFQIDETDSFCAKHRWETCRPVPQKDEWFENVWRDFRENKIFE